MAYRLGPMVAIPVRLVLPASVARRRVGSIGVQRIEVPRVGGAEEEATIAANVDILNKGSLGKGIDLLYRVGDCGSHNSRERERERENKIEMEMEMEKHL